VYIRGRELMKLIFAVLDVSLTMGLTRCYKTEVFLHLSRYRSRYTVNTCVVEYGLANTL